MDDHALRDHRIVVALDRSEYAEVVLEHALDQAARHDAVDVHFLTVVEDETEVEDVKRRLGELVLQGLDGLDASAWRARLHVRVGLPAQEIADLAAEIRAHLIVVGRFGLHHASRRLGSVANRVVEAATCPVLVIGMFDQESTSQPQCPDCVAVRAASDGERWFCVAHSAHEHEFTTFLQSATWTGGSLMW